MILPAKNPAAKGLTAGAFLSTGSKYRCGVASFSLKLSLAGLELTRSGGRLSAFESRPLAGTSFRSSSARDSQGRSDGAWGCTSPR